MKFSSKQISEQDLTYRVISGELLNLYPDIIPKVVSLSELQEAIVMMKIKVRKNGLFI